MGSEDQGPASEGHADGLYDIWRPICQVCMLKQGPTCSLLLAAAPDRAAAFWSICPRAPLLIHTARPRLDTAAAGPNASQQAEACSSEETTATSIAEECGALLLDVVQARLLSLQLTEVFSTAAVK